MKVEALFDVRNGVPTTGLEVLSSPGEATIPFLRPASTQQRTVAGWVTREAIPSQQVFPAETLFVSTNGEGSHTYAYVSSFEFACNSDVSALLPLAEMSLPEKIFYAHCITRNRFRFSYGRKPKGRRLKSIDLPDFPVGWNGAAAPAVAEAASQVVGNEGAPPPRRTSEACSGLARLDALFDIRPGHGLDLTSLERVETGGVRFVSRAKRNNGVSAQVKRIAGVDPNPAGELTCALNGEGGVLYTFLQDEPFYTAYHVARLRPREPMTREELLFYCTCIRANRFRYSYGRQANRTIASIKVPTLGSVPPHVHGSLARVVSAAGFESVAAKMSETRNNPAPPSGAGPMRFGRTERRL